MRPRSQYHIKLVYQSNPIYILVGRSCYLLILNYTKLGFPYQPVIFMYFVALLFFGYFFSVSWLNNAMPGGLPRGGLIPRGFGDLFADGQCPCGQMDLRRIDGSGLHVRERAWTMSRGT